MKIFRFIALAKKISKQPRIDSVVPFLGFMCMKSILMKSSKLSKEKYKMYFILFKF